ncbi:MAG TPA: twin-arginine translocase subunit TatC [Candidatus Polarisedimenticolia bacterium]|nr:twin-arginine translocase subunit TatC [Candidatus Polarisedimenticolia bacterium]
MWLRSGDPNQMSFLQHLEELRARLMRCVLVLVAGFFLAWPFSGRIYDVLVSPVRSALPEGARLAYTGLSDPFMLYTKISIFAAIFAALPYTLFEFWLFISPGLYPRERRWAVPFVAITSFFFFLGAAFAHRVIVPFSCLYFISLGTEGGFQPVITIKEVFSFVMQMILATGAVFELPVIIFFLTRIGITTPAFLWQYFGYAFFGIWVAAAFVTPPDVISMVMVGAPMTLLYLLGIVVSWASLKLSRRARELSGAEAPTAPSPE